MDVDTFEAAPPPNELRVRLACRLLAREGDLDREVMRSLLVTPKRYSELKPLLGERGDHTLTVTLKRLQGEGLLERRTNARESPVVHQYSLTPLGVQVVLTMSAVEELSRELSAAEPPASSALALLARSLIESPENALGAVGAGARVAGAVLDAASRPGSLAPDALLVLVRLLLARYERSREEGDWVRAESMLRDAIAKTPEASPDLPRLLAALAEGFLRRYQVTGDAAALDEGIVLAERSLRSGGRHRGAPA